MHDCGDNTRAAGNRQSHKVAAISGGTCAVDVEAGQPCRTADHESKRNHPSGLAQMLGQLRSRNVFDWPHAPGEGQKGRRDTEADHVRQRVEFASEVRTRVGQPRDPAVQGVEENGIADRLGCVVEVTPQSREDRDVAADEGARREEAGQQVHALAQAPSRLQVTLEFC